MTFGFKSRQSDSQWKAVLEFLSEFLGKSLSLCSEMTEQVERKSRNVGNDLFSHMGRVHPRIKSTWKESRAKRMDS